jgi:hypothetical protein
MRIEGGRNPKVRNHSDPNSNNNSSSLENIDELDSLEHQQNMNQNRHQHRRTESSASETLFASKREMIETDNHEERGANDDENFEAYTASKRSHPGHPYETDNMARQHQHQHHHPPHQHQMYPPDFNGSHGHSNDYAVNFQAYNDMMPSQTYEGRVGIKPLDLVLYIYNINKIEKIKPGLYQNASENTPSRKI